MSSGTPIEMGASSKAIALAAEGPLDKWSLAGQRPGAVMTDIEASGVQRAYMNPRQLRLDRLWRHYEMKQYDECRVDWNGHETNEANRIEGIMRKGQLDAGYRDVGQTLPVQFRKPTKPSGLITRVVNRFCGLLFSEKRLPRWNCYGDPDSEDYATAVAKVGKFWLAMRNSKRFGGAMGTSLFGFRIIKGRPEFEALDPRWVNPEWKDRSRLELSSIEIRYLYPQDDFDEVERRNVTSWVWYRRIVNELTDTIFQPEFFDPREDKEPDWQVKETVAHNMGFVPYEWIQNMPNPSDVDGIPDYPERATDLVHGRDQLKAVAHKACLGICDPTWWISTDADQGDIKMGSDHTLVLPQGSTAGALQANGESVKTTLEAASGDEEDFLELCDCVLEETEKAMTAFEVERRRDRMYAKGDEQRGQYGDAATSSMQKVFKVVTQMGGGRPDAGQGILLPPRVQTDEEGKTKRLPRKLGPGPWFMSLDWPRYTLVPLTDVQQAVDAAAKAKIGELVDVEHAAKSIAEFFGVENVQEMLATLAAKREQDRQQALDDMQAIQPTNEDGGGGNKGKGANAGTSGGLKLGGTTIKL